MDAEEAREAEEAMGSGEAREAKEEKDLVVRCWVLGVGDRFNFKLPIFPCPLCSSCLCPLRPS
jgi:hypothetical protein